jgi:hypothetical protein
MENFWQTIQPWLAPIALVISLVNLYVAWRDRQVRCQVILKYVPGIQNLPYFFPPVQALIPLLDLIIINHSKDPVWISDIQLRNGIGDAGIELNYQYRNLDSEKMGELGEGIKIDGKSRARLWIDVKAIPNKQDQVINVKSDIWLQAVITLATSKRFHSRPILLPVEKLLWRSELPSESRE